MPRLPDLSAYTFDQLQTLVSAANKRMDDIRGKHIKEIQAELSASLDLRAAHRPLGRAENGRARVQGHQQGRRGLATAANPFRRSFEGRMERSTQGEAQSLGGPGSS